MIGPGYVVVPLVLAGVAVAALAPLLMGMANRGQLYDRRTERKLHPSGISRLGGLAMFAGMAVAGLAAMLWGSHSFSGRLAVAFAVGFTPVFAVSVWDDLRPLPWWIRLAVQMIGALLFAVIQQPVWRLSLPVVGTFEPGWWQVPIVVAWLVLTMNALNFIDGLDGLAAGIALIAAAAMLVSAYRVGFVAPVALAAALIGVCVGFLPYNFHPARIFMGDSGATLLGFVLGVIGLVGAGKNMAFVSLLLPLLALGVPISDVVDAVIRRSAVGKSIFDADREHVHHRLLLLGLGYRRTVILLYLLSGLLGGLGLLLSARSRWAVVPVAAMAAVCLVLLFRSGRTRAGASR